jgi:hypothetical protein
MAQLRAEGDGDKTTQDPLRDELWRDQLHDTMVTAAHGRFMAPICRSISEGTFFFID